MQAAGIVWVMLCINRLGFLMGCQCILNKARSPNSCGTVKVGLSSAQQTSACVKPKVGCTAWVCVDLVFSFKQCSLGVRAGRLMHASSFKEDEVWDTFVKVDGMYESCKNVKSWLINFRHLSLPWINSLRAHHYAQPVGYLFIVVLRWGGGNQRIVLWYLPGILAVGPESI